ncbi:glycosyltransferase [Halodesulfovibrio sp.]|uniref:glycosyltransferase n=1 Tax=Halodesulfovibrio sp. TaxID=1912772 RepID=UPI0025C40807|nr:glycosyltransferase [Halodesulfovibrio sp.]
MSLSEITPAPVALFTYNRPDHTRRTVEALQQNPFASQSDLFVFCDGAKSSNDAAVIAVREYVNSITGFNSLTVIERETNIGLAKSIIEGVTDVVSKFGAVIVLEDDLITSPYFLSYMNICLQYYERFEDVFSVSGWAPPTLLQVRSEYSVAFFPRTCSWGWATWQDQWHSVDWSVADYEQFKYSRSMQKEFNNGGPDLTKMLHAQMNGDVDSWAIRFCYSQFRQQKLSVYPIHSYVENIGCDGSGVHCNIHITQQLAVKNEEDLCLPNIVYEDEDIIKLFVNFYSPPPFFIRCINKLSRALIGKNIVTYEDTELEHL